MLKRAWVLVLVVVGLVPGLGSAAQKKIAVLELHNPAGLSDQEVAYITDVVRGAALELPRARYFVMTRENIMDQLPPGKDLAECEGDCEVETGRNVGADYVVSGEVIRFGQSLRVSMKLYETRRGALLGTRTGSGANVEALEAPVRKAASALFAPLRGRREAPRGPSRDLSETPEAWEPDTRARLVIVEFESSPAGAVVLVDGEVVCQSTAKACRKTVSAGSHEVSMQRVGYLPRTETVELRSKASLRWTLEPNFGFIEVTSEPSGLGVSIDRESVGRTPYRSGELAPGSYEVRVESPCHYRAGRVVQLARGAREVVEVRPAPRPAAIEITAEDGDGNAVEAAVWVDGEEVGRAPGVFKTTTCARKIEVRDAKLGDWSEAVRLKEKETKRLRARLGAPRAKPTAVARRRPAPEPSGVGAGLIASVGEGALLADNTDAARTGVNVEGGLGLRLGAFTPEVSVLAGVEAPALVVLRAGLRGAAGPFAARVTGQLAVSPVTVGGLFFGAGPLLRLAGKWSVVAEVGATVWSAAPSMIPVEGRVGVAYGY